MSPSRKAVLVQSSACLGWGKGALSLLAYERLVDVGDDAAPGDGGLDQRVQLLVSADSELRYIM